MNHFVGGPLVDRIAPSTDFGPKIGPRSIVRPRGRGAQVSEGRFRRVGAPLVGTISRPEPRAIVFNLDDTLYPVDSVVVSGLTACADHLDQFWGIDRDEALSVLLDASRGETRGRELQVCAVRFRLPDDVVSTLIGVMRAHHRAVHVPADMRLPGVSRWALARLRAGWRVAVVADGPPDLQLRKVQALRLRSLVDAVVYSRPLRSGGEASSRDLFLEAACRLGVAMDRAVAVADDRRCDLFGAACAGMQTIHYRRGSRVGARPPIFVADASVHSLGDVPAIADRLVPLDPAVPRHRPGPSLEDADVVA